MGFSKLCSFSVSVHVLMDMCVQLPTRVYIHVGGGQKTTLVSSLGMSSTYSETEFPVGLELTNQTTVFIERHFKD